MRNPHRLTRRQLAGGLLTGVAASALGANMPRAFAQSTTAPSAADLWATLAQISADARKLGLGVPLVTAANSGPADYRELFPATVDFIEKLGEAAARSGQVPQADIVALRKRANDLLRTIQNDERAKRQRSDLDVPAPGRGFSLFVSPAHAQSANDERFKKYHDGYLKLFDTCTVRSQNKSEIDWYMSKLTNDRYRARYETVAAAVCVPWYFVGIVHALEAGFNFDLHLHNGDPLSDRTVNVPANRPLAWRPPNDWEASARDALEYERFTNQTDWSLARTLFRYEAYNGFRSREEHGINTPYLWSFSNHYDSGKFVADNVWSEDAVSKQCGAGVLLHELVTRNLVQFTA